MRNLVLIEAGTEPTEQHIFKIQGKIKRHCIKNNIQPNSILLHVTGKHRNAFLTLIKSHHLNFSTRLNKEPYLLKINITS